MTPPPVLPPTSGDLGVALPGHFECAICRITVTSTATLAEHNRGRAHLRKARMAAYRAARTVNGGGGATAAAAALSTPWFCTVCNCHIDAALSLLRHTTGRSHRRATSLLLDAGHGDTVAALAPTLREAVAVVGRSGGDTSPWVALVADTEVGSGRGGGGGGSGGGGGAAIELDRHRLGAAGGWREKEGTGSGRDRSRSLERDGDPGADGGDLVGRGRPQLHNRSPVRCVRRRSSACGGRNRSLDDDGVGSGGRGGRDAAAGSPPHRTHADRSGERSPPRAVHIGGRPGGVGSPPSRFRLDYGRERPDGDDHVSSRCGGGGTKRPRRFWDGEDGQGGRVDGRSPGRGRESPAGGDDGGSDGGGGSRGSASPSHEGRSGSGTPPAEPALADGERLVMVPARARLLFECAACSSVLRSVGAFRNHACREGTKPRVASTGGERRMGGGGLRATESGRQRPIS